MKAFFQAVGMVLLAVVMLIATVVLLYLSYVLAIGLVICFLVYTVYTMLSTSSETPSDSQSAV